MPDARVTQTTAAPFIPEIWGNMIVGKIAGTLILGSVVNRNFADAPQAVGDIVNVPVRGALTVQDKASGAVVEAQAPADATVQVLLNKHKVVSFAVPSDVDAMANVDVMAGYLEDAAVAIAEQMEIDGLTAAYTGFTTNVVGSAGTALSEANVISVRQKLVEAKTPQSAPRYLFLNPRAVATALGIARLTEADKLGIPEGPIRSGAIGRLHGLTVIESQYVVIVAGAPDAVNNVALHPDALTLAMRTLKAPRSPNVANNVAAGSTENGTQGIGIRITMAWDQNYLSDRAAAEALYGWKVVRETFGVKYVT